MTMNRNDADLTITATDDHDFCDADECTNDERCFDVDPGADDRD